MVHSNQSIKAAKREAPATACSFIHSSPLYQAKLPKPSAIGWLTKLSLIAILAGLSSLAQAQDQNPLQVEGINSTQSNIADTIITICPSGVLAGTELQDRCNALVGATGEDGSTVLNALQQVSPEQIISQGTRSTRAARNMQFNRLHALRIGTPGLLTSYNNSNGRYTTLSWSPSNGLGGGAGADDMGLGDRLGIFVNGIGGFGDVDSSFNQLGFDFDSSGVLAGVDYRFTDNFILGLAFNYLRTDANFNRDGGRLDSDTYSGSLYGTLYAANSFHIDWVATYGGVSYDSIRNISYAVPGEVINTQSTASPDGKQFSGALSAGYDFTINALTISPYLRGEYINLDINSFSDQDPLGWGVRYADQSIESLTTALGTRIAYAISTQWGVVQPFVRGEWFHEYEDDRRNIAANFVQDPTRERFNIVTDSPDRNFYTFGTGISATFAKGISAFFNYDVLLGRDNISSHMFMLGARMEL